MESLYLLIPIALAIIVLAIKILFWAINNGQYDDLKSEGHRILFDEPIEKAPRPSASATPIDTEYTDIATPKNSVVDTDKPQHEDQR